jgi:chromate reductase
MVHLVGIGGSLRKASINVGILREVKKALPAGVTMDIVIPDLPLYNQDIEASRVIPESVQSFRDSIRKADGFIFGTSEYNGSISGAMKNALDWGTRGKDGGNLFNDKSAGIISAGGVTGATKAALHLRDIAAALNLHTLNHPQFAFRIFENPTYFDSKTGDVIDPKVQEQIAKFTNAYLEWHARVSRK